MNIKYIATLGMVGFLGLSFPCRIFAAPIQISYDGNSYQYSDLQVKYVLNGKEIKTKYPGVIINGVSLASIDEVFVKSGTGIKYKFDKATGKIEIKKGKDIYVMQTGSFEARFNNEIKWLPLAPRLITFKDKKSKLYVPARSVATAFGFTYNWDPIGVASFEGEVPAKPKKQQVSKITYQGKTREYKDSKVLFMANGVQLNNSERPGVYINSVLMAPAKFLFLNDILEGGYVYHKSAKFVTVEYDDKVLKMKIGSKDATINKKKIKLSAPPFNLKYNFSGKAGIVIPVHDVCKALGLSIETKGAISKLTVPSLEEIASTDKTSNTKKSGDKASTSSEKKGDSFGSDKKEDKKDKEKDKKDKEKDKKDKEKDSVEKEVNEKEKNDSKKPNEASNTDPSSQSKTPDGLLFDWTSPMADAVSTPDKTEIKGLVNDVTVTSTLLDTVQIDGMDGKKADTYMLISDNGFFDVGSELNGNVLKLHLSNFVMDEKKNFFFRQGGMSERAETISDKNLRKTTISFDLSEIPYSYDLSLSPDNKVLSLKMNRNVITALRAEKQGESFRIKLTSTSPFDLSTLDRMDSETLNFSIKGIGDAVGAKNFIYEYQTEGLRSLAYYGTGDSLSLLILKRPDYGYKIVKRGLETEILISRLDLLQFGVTIPTPDSAENYKIIEEDDYLNKTIKLTFPYDLSAFWQYNPIWYDTSKIVSHTIEVDQNGRSVLSLKTKEMQAFRVFKTTKSVTLKLGKANEFYKKVLVIDPGHGGHDTGALSVDKKYKEKDVVLAVGHTYLKDYFDDPDLKVYWTRKGDTFMTLSDRAKFASRIGADMFISIHANAAANKKAMGTEVYYSARNNVVKPNGISSYLIAGELQKNLTSGMKTVNRGVRERAFVVVNSNTVPAVLIELGFITNEKDLKMLTSEEKQDEMAGIIYDTVTELFDYYPTGR